MNCKSLMNKMNFSGRIFFFQLFHLIIIHTRVLFHKYSYIFSDLIVFTSKEKVLAGQMIAFTDEDEIISVAEFNESKCIGDTTWPKAGIAQFLCAVRGKCFEFFFETPLSVSKRGGVRISNAL